MNRWAMIDLIATNRDDRLIIAIVASERARLFFAEHERSYWVSSLPPEVPTEDRPWEPLGRMSDL